MMSESVVESVTNASESNKLTAHGDVKVNGESVEKKSEAPSVERCENDQTPDESRPTPSATEPVSDPSPVDHASEEKNDLVEKTGESIDTKEVKPEETPKEHQSPNPEKTETTDVKEKAAESPVAAKEESPVVSKAESPVVSKTESPVVSKETPEDKKEEKEEKESSSSPGRKRKLSPDKSEKESDEESEEEIVGTLEADPVIEDGVKRVRKKTERLSDVIGKDRAQKEDDKNKNIIPEGTGVPLGEIEFISHKLKTSKPDDLRLLHLVAIGRVGKQSSLRANLRKFKGFEFSTDSAEYKKKLAKYVGDRKVKMAAVKTALKVVGLELKGTRDDLVERLLEFLAKPVDNGKTPKTKGKSSSKKTPSKRGRKSKSTKKEESSDEEDNEEDDEEEEMEVEETPKPKKTGKRGRPSKGSAKSTPKKKATPKKKSKKESEESDISSHDDDDEDEPEAKKAKKMPSDEELKKTVLSLLEDVDLEKVTMKNVLQQIYDKYDGLDLTHKKEYLKSVVKDILSN